MITSIKINVQEHFLKMLLRYINLGMDIKENKRNLCLNELESESLEEIWSLLVPHAEGNSPIPNLVLFLFSQHTVACLCCMNNMGLKSLALFHYVILSNQSHVRIDTVILYSHIFELTRKEAEEKVDMKYELWSQVFNLNSKAFQSTSSMSFEGSITTDGTSISVYLKHPVATKSME
ncbi:hypothetical protein HDU92_005145 [Lobulomyces angularis]|nr:hypothetical protein HDU92_005145 [Lobulomyces angularis]